jgi:hypothetical protein
MNVALLNATSSWGIQDGEHQEGIDSCNRMSHSCFRRTFHYDVPFAFLIEHINKPLMHLQSNVLTFVRDILHKGKSFTNQFLQASSKSDSGDRFIHDLAVIKQLLCIVKGCTHLNNPDGGKCVLHSRGKSNVALTSAIV